MKNDIAYLRVDRDSIDVLVSDESLRTACTNGSNDSLSTISDWLVKRLVTTCRVTLSSRCCFICHFEIPDSSAAVSDTAIRFAAEAHLPLAMEEICSVYFRRDQDVLFVAARRSLLELLKALPVKILAVVPESLLLASDRLQGDSHRSALLINTEVQKELITWDQTPLSWHVAAPETDSRLLQPGSTISETDTVTIEPMPDEATLLAREAFERLPRRALSRIDLMSDPSIRADNNDSAIDSVLRTCQLVFVCGLIVTCALLFRQKRLDERALDVRTQRRSVVSLIFENPSDHISDRKLLSELRLRQDREQVIRDWQDQQPNIVQRFAEVVDVLGAETAISIQSLGADLQDVEVLCEVQTKERTAMLTKAIAEAGFDVQLLSQRPANGLVSVNLLLTPVLGDSP